MLSIDELMITRFKVVANYPKSTYKIGAIIHCFDVKLMNESYFKTYPAIFQLLEWWMERKEGDMPEYVKQLNGESVYKVRTHFDYEDSKGWGFVADHDGVNRYYSKYFPATEADYLTYKQSK